MGVTDEQVKQIIGQLLRAGVVLAALVVLVGAVPYLVQHGTSTPQYRVFRGEPSDLRSVPGIIRTAAAQDPRGLMQLGLILLIATPVSQVALSLVAFALERDGTYVLITAIVLGLLLWSLSGSAA